MPQLSEYANKYRNVQFTREDGILQIRLHTNGGPLTWGAIKGSVHGQLADAFYDVGNDLENRVVIITGTGDEFCTQFNLDELPELGKTMSHEDWYILTHEGKRLLANLLDIEMPVIGVANGPALIHAELIALSDIVLAAEHATFGDAAHYPINTVPGDGAHTTWLSLLGPNRGRYFLMMGEQIPAAEAKSLGIVGEVLPADKLLARAWDIARTLIQKPDRVLRYSRVTLTQRLKKQLLDELGYGLSLEGHGL
jgi:enoyl-CoA hydratase/carnithine racemase